ncbi:uncharacterized protein G2W53_028216 [Senna tora]|uniref:Uncharacterized protein n=1 Tax=Senna tora TaxID=362788 RepID=A0A834T5M1_9FABA|nr:uncharacterized protein G2W53_028216 [Senna tora]
MKMRISSTLKPTTEDITEETKTAKYCCDDQSVFFLEFFMSLKQVGHCRLARIESPGTPEETRRQGSDVKGLRLSRSQRRD